MALRLTTASAPKAARRSPAELAALARMYLGRGDVGAYTALFADVAEETDEHRRFRGRLTLLEAAMGSSAPPKVLPKVLLAAAKAGLDLLEEEAREPLFLNYTGVLCYELGGLKPAEQLFKAAKRLDPDLPHVSRNLEQLARRRRQNVDVLRSLPRQISLELGALSGRVQSVVGRAQPARGKRVSLVRSSRTRRRCSPVASRRSTTWWTR